jgi:thioredoxin 1
VILLTNENFAETVFATSAGKLTMVQFTANWCDSCREFQSTLEQLKELYKISNVTFAKVDIDQSPEIADQYKVDKLPTFLFFKNRQLINFIIGTEPIGHFKRAINDALNS